MSNTLPSSGIVLQLVLVWLLKDDAGVLTIGNLLSLDDWLIFWFLVLESAHYYIIDGVINTPGPTIGSIRLHHQQDTSQNNSSLTPRLHPYDDYTDCHAHRKNLITNIGQA